jgi:hypothetical protein
VVLSVTEQLPEPPGATVKGAQVSEDSVPRSVNETASALELPFSVADMEAVWAVEKSSACAVNATDEEPAATVSPLGETVRIGLLLDKEIEAVAPAGTGCVRFTVHDVNV